MGVIWHKNLSITVFIALTILTLASILIFEAFQKPQPECTEPGWHATVLGDWDDTSGPCTYLQRAAFDAIILFAYPIFMLFPIISLSVFYLLYRIYKHTKGGVTKRMTNKIVIIYSGTLFVWFAIMAIMQFLDET